jgi:hypothetical protein
MRENIMDYSCRMTAKSMGKFLFAAGLALAAPAFAQSVPAYNVTDMWWNPAESGWGIAMQHSTTSNQVYALWHTFDSRDLEGSTSSSSDYKPIWIAMTGGTWTSPTRLEGDAYVSNATAYWMPFVPGSFQITRVGRFTFNFTSSTQATFTFEFTPPANVASTDPAFGFPTLTGTKNIQRYAF